MSRYCASSLETIRQAANAVQAGQGDAYIAAGVEWVSRYNEAVEGARPQDQNEKLLGRNGQPDAYISMGMTAENVADRYEVSRADMDKYAQRSQELAVQSQENGYFDREIVPITLPDGTTIAKDDGPRASSTLEKLPSSIPAFREGGKVTAGNSCPLNDGAAAVLVMSADKAAELGLEPARPDHHLGHGRDRAGVHGRGADRSDPQGARPRRDDDRGRGHGRAERGVRRPGDPDHGRVRHPAREDEPARRGDRAGPPPSG